MRPRTESLAGAFPGPLYADETVWMADALEFIRDTPANRTSLYAALRRPHDDKATNRKDSGQFDGSAFAKMLYGCKEIVIPDQPFNKVK